MKFISLFAGVGGFDLALTRLGHECVYANDFDKYCKIIYDKNFLCRPTGQEEKEDRVECDSADTQGKYTRKFTNCYNYTKHGLDTRSITDVTTDEIPDHELPQTQTELMLVKDRHIKSTNPSTQTTGFTEQTVLAQPLTLCKEEIDSQKF